MAVFTFTSPDGKSYSVNGPDGATQEQAFAILQQHLKLAGAAADPTEGMSTGDKFTAGMGKAFMDTFTGLQQLGAGAAQKLGILDHINAVRKKIGMPEVTPESLQADVQASKTLDKPLMSTTAGKVGNAAGDVAMLAAAPEGMAGAIGGSAALAAAQPVVGDQSRAANTLLGAAGGAIGAGAGKVAGAAMQPVTDALSGAGRWARTVLARESVPLDAAQATGSKVAQSLKNAAGDAPFVEGSGFPETQKRAFTRAALDKMGITNADEASPAVMAAGKRRLQTTYDQIANRNSITPDADLTKDIGDIRYAANRGLTRDHNQVIQNTLDDLESMIQQNGGRLSGEGYQQLQSQLRNMAKDGGKAPYITEIKQALTSALQRQAQPGDAALLAQTNQRYAAMKALEKAVGDDNQVSPAKLFGALDTAKNAGQTVYGYGPNQALIELAQAGKLLLGRGTPNSGTATRTAGLLMLGGSGDAVYHLAKGDNIKPEEMLAVATLAGLSGAAARQLVYSPTGRQWLTRWAQSRVAATAAQAAGRAGQVGGGTAAAQSMQSQPAVQ